MTQNYQSWSPHEEEHALFLNCVLVVVMRFFPYALCWWDFILPHACQHVLCECLRKDMTNVGVSHLESAIGFLEWGDDVDSIF